MADKKKKKKKAASEGAEKQDRKVRDAARNLKGSLIDYPFLMAVKPKEAYIFRSNDYECDGYWYTILSFFHKDGAYDDFGPFWGIARIPTGLSGKDVSVTCVTSVERMGDGWVREHQQKAEDVAQMNATETAEGNSKTNYMQAGKRDRDLEIVAMELQSGASYVRCAYRMQVRAKTREGLREALSEIERLYMDRFSTLYAESYDGMQANELSTLLRPIDMKKGSAFYMTSTEAAGEYSLVTRGIEDRGGVYIGQMTADVNTAAILYDLDNYENGKHIVVCSEQVCTDRENIPYRANVPDMWASKISQACLMNDHKVVHIILDGAKMDLLGPAFASITRTLNMNRGDVNPFEVFGSADDELTLFAAQLQKLVLMNEQVSPPTEAERTLVRGALQEIATQFYIDKHMWVANPEDNRERIRLVGIPHKDIPQLYMFNAYLGTAHLASVNNSRDQERIHALGVLRTSFKTMLDTNSDLFNTITNPEIDGVGEARRVIYDFSELRPRGMGVMMAQLVNVFAMAVSGLGEGDTLFIHGSELIANSVKEYLLAQMDQLRHRGGRVCFCYNKNDRMLTDVGFSEMDNAEYTIMGTMTDNTAAKYQDVLGQTIPSNLARQLTTKNPALTFLHRDFSNVVFERDLILNPATAEYRVPRRPPEAKAVTAAKRRGGAVWARRQRP